jgi:hypothetical protein
MSFRLPYCKPVQIKEESNMEISIDEFRTQMHGLVIGQLKNTAGSDASKSHANNLRLESIAFFTLCLGILSYCVSVWCWLISLS